LNKLNKKRKEITEAKTLQYSTEVEQYMIGIVIFKGFGWV